MTISVVIPWRDTGCPYRNRNLSTTLDNLTRAGLNPILADDPTCDRFNISAARNRGVEQSDSDVVIVMDADMHICTSALHAAARRAVETGALCYPYRNVLYVDETGTQELITDLPITRGKVLHRSTNAPGGCAVLTRDAYQRIGGWDETFAGWGYEDNDFAERAIATVGLNWGYGDAHHMWHPQTKQGERGNRDALNANRSARAETGDVYVIIPTHTQPDTLRRLIDNAGLPCIIIHTDKKSRDIPGVINLRDEGPVNIHRWWNLGIREAEARGATMVVVANHDATPADSTQLPRMVQRTRETGATWGYVNHEDTPLQTWNGRRRGYGWCWTLNLTHGLRPDENYIWYYGDEKLDLLAQTHHHGAVGINVDVTHHKNTTGRQYPAEFEPYVQADQQRFHAEKRAILRDTVTPLSIVRRVRPGDDNEELRYSNRSLINYPHRDLWIIGHKPPWVTNAHHLPGDRYDTKWPNMFDGIVRACRNPDISDPFILWDDDVYAWEPLWRIETLHKGRLDATIEIPGSEWRATLEAALRWCNDKGIPDPLCYETHTPFVIEKAKMLEVAASAKGYDYINPAQLRSCYGNYWKIGGREMPDDVKLSTEHARITPHGGFLSTSDRTFARIRRTIRSRFPNPSQYEEA